MTILLKKKIIPQIYSIQCCLDLNFNSCLVCFFSCKWFYSLIVIISHLEIQLLLQYPGYWILFMRIWVSVNSSMLQRYFHYCLLSYILWFLMTNVRDHTLLSGMSLQRHNFRAEMSRRNESGQEIFFTVRVVLCFST